MKTLDDFYGILMAAGETTEGECVMTHSDIRAAREHFGLSKGVE